jgi:hypothetical protein
MIMINDVYGIHSYFNCLLVLVGKRRYADICDADDDDDDGSGA